jgi:hypothetical protein
MHGSVAIRAEFESNLAIFNDGGKRFFAAETRIGKPIQPTELLAEVIEVDGADVVATFSLGTSKEALEDEVETQSARKTDRGYQDQILELLETCPDGLPYKDVLAKLTGKKERLVSAVQRLIEQGVVTESGSKGSHVNPYTLRLDSEAAKRRDFTLKFGARQADVQ